jgi:hypothetical protein
MNIPWRGGDCLLIFPYIISTNLFVVFLWNTELEIYTESWSAKDVGWKWLWPTLRQWQNVHVNHVSRANNFKNEIKMLPTWFSGTRHIGRKYIICHLHPLNLRLVSHFPAVYVGRFWAQVETRYGSNLHSCLLRFVYSISTTLGFG